MYVFSSCRSCDHKNQIGQRAVKRLIIHTLRHCYGCQPRFLYCFYLCVGNGNPFPDCCAPQAFSCKNPFLITDSVIQPPPCIHKGDETINSLLLGSCLHSQFNALLFQQFCDPHPLLPSIFCTLCKQIHDHFSASHTI